MRINISAIKGHYGEQLKRSYNLSQLPCMQWGEDAELLSPIQVCVSVTNTGSCYLLRGKLDAQLQLICHRCMKPYQWHLNIPLEEEYFPAEKQTDEENEAEHQFAQVSTFSGDVIDIREAVSEQAILGLPTKNLCSPNCPGICPSCGADLAIKECSCSTRQIDPRLAPLASFLADDAEGEPRK